jgi:periplasmic copper chaperone A
MWMPGRIFENTICSCPFPSPILLDEKIPMRCSPFFKAMRRSSLGLATCLALAALSAMAPAALSHGFTAGKQGEIVIGHPWARATAPGTTNGAAYMALKNQGTTDDRLLTASTPIATKTDIHEHRMDQGMMMMRPVQGGLELKAGAAADFSPGQYHLMLIGLKEPLRQGSTFPMTLTFAKAGSIVVHVLVQGPGDSRPREPGAPPEKAPADAAHEHQHGHQH